MSVMSKTFPVVSVMSVGRPHRESVVGDRGTVTSATASDWTSLAAAAANIGNARLTSLLLPGVGTAENLRRAWGWGCNRRG